MWHQLDKCETAYIFEFMFVKFMGLRSMKLSKARVKLREIRNSKSMQSKRIFLCKTNE